MAESFFPPLLPPIILRARRLVEGVHLGSHRSRRRGEGAEFAEYRFYRPGDPLRQLDWRVFARTDRLYVRLREQEVSRRAWIILDDSLSMDFGAPEPKLLRGKLLAAAFALLFERTGDTYGVESTGGELALPARRGRAHRGEILRRLEELRAAAGAEERALAEAVERRNREGRRGRLLVLVSDFLGDLAAFGESLGRWAAGGGDLVACHLVDRAELDLVDDGPVRYRDPETGEERETLTPEVRSDYRAAVLGHIAAVRNLVEGRGFDHLLIGGEEDLRGVLLRLLRRRARCRQS